MILLNFHHIFALCLLFCLTAAASNRSEISYDGILFADFEMDHVDLDHGIVYKDAEMRMWEGDTEMCGADIKFLYTSGTPVHHRLSVVEGGFCVDDEYATYRFEDVSFENLHYEDLRNLDVSNYEDFCPELWCWGDKPLSHNYSAIVYTDLGNFYKIKFLNESDFGVYFKYQMLLHTPPKWSPCNHINVDERIQYDSIDYNPMTGDFMLTGAPVGFFALVRKIVIYAWHRESFESALIRKVVIKITPGTSKFPLKSTPLQDLRDVNAFSIRIIGNRVGKGSISTTGRRSHPIWECVEKLYLYYEPTSTPTNSPTNVCSSNRCIMDGGNVSQISGSAFEYCCTHAGHDHCQGEPCCRGENCRSGRCIDAANGQDLTEYAPGSGICQ